MILAKEKSSTGWRPSRLKTAFGIETRRSRHQQCPWRLRQAKAHAGRAGGRSDELATSIVVCPLTSDVQGHIYRVVVPAGLGSGLRVRSEVMVEKIQALDAGRLKPAIGRVGSDVMDAVDRALILILGLGRRNA